MEVTLKVTEEIEDTEPVCLANFSNGIINPEASHKLKMTLYKKKGERYKKRRVLVAKTKHMSYVGTNHETQSGLITPTYCKYLIGSLDKDSGVMTLHKADVYNMTPYIEGRTGEVTMAIETPQKSSYTREDYTNTFDKMVQSFGSERAKRAWSTAKRNKIDSTLLDSTLGPAVSHAEDELKRAEEEDPQEHIVQTSSFIPPCNTQATDPSDVYNLTDIITPIEMELLKSPAKTLIKATKQDVTKWRDNESRSEYVLSHVSSLPKGAGANKTASVLVYCDYLIKMFRLPPKQIERFGLTKLKYIPEPLQCKLLERFTEQGPQGSTEWGVVTKRMKDKILSHLFVLTLIIDQFTLDTRVLQRDLKIPSNKVLDIFKALGCSLSVDTSIKREGLTAKSYIAVLKTPLTFDKTPRKGGKRRR